jgi:hypothetical protein
VLVADVIVHLIVVVGMISCWADFLRWASRRGESRARSEFQGEKVQQ